MTHDDEDPPADERTVAERREVEPLRPDDLLAELLLLREARRAVELADLLVQRQANGLDGDVAALAVRARDTLEERAEERAGKKLEARGQRAVQRREAELLSSGSATYPPPPMALHVVKQRKGERAGRELSEPVAGCGESRSAKERRTP